MQTITPRVKFPGVESWLQVKKYSFSNAVLNVLNIWYRKTMACMKWLLMVLGRCEKLLQTCTNHTALISWQNGIIVPDYDQNNHISAFSPFFLGFRNVWKFSDVSGTNWNCWGVFRVRSDAFRIDDFFGLETFFLVWKQRSLLLGKNEFSCLEGTNSPGEKKINSPVRENTNCRDWKKFFCLDRTNCLVWEERGSCMDGTTWF